jgi:crotonobetainyl-CoA:carnitine CoA-transferase CaiB-like acyl-CoA transferase
MSSNSRPPQALDDLLVLDLTHYIAGPYCTKLLADYGARVIKIERPDGGDPCRRLGPFPDDVPHPEKSGLFLHLNTNKESVTLNLKLLRGRQLFMRLVAKVDVVVENFHPRVMTALGLDYPCLRPVNTRLLMTSISNFGQTGPYWDWRAQDLTLYGMGGEMYTSGAAGREPLKQAHNLTLYQGGAVAATAIMVGLMGVRRHGVGQYLDVSLFETQAGSIDRRMTSLVAYQYTGDNPGPGDALPVGILPSGIFRCQDGHVDIRCTMRWWPRLVAMMEMPELNDDPRFSTEEARLNPVNRAPFLQIFHAWLQRHTRQEIVRKAQKVRLPGTAVNTPAQVLDDPHFVERGAFVSVAHPLAGTWKLPGAPSRPSVTPWQIHRPAPLLGQDTERVLRELLCLSDTEIHELRQAGVIA